MVQQYWLRIVLSSSKELQIWQDLDRFEKPRWHIYDPLTSRHVYCASEDEVRAWIETHYRTDQRF